MKKKLLVLIAAVFGFFYSNAQIITQADFDAIDMTQFDTNGDGKIKDDEAAQAIMQLYNIDKNNSITRVQIVDGIDKTKEEIYVEVNDWFVHSFQSGKSVIQLNDKDAGCVIGKGYVSNMGSTYSFLSNSDISAWVIIRVDIKDGKMRITTTMQSYEMERGTGMLGAFAVAAGANAAAATKTAHQEFIPTECFPFTTKHKKEGAKAFVKGHLYSLVIINKLTEAVKNGLTGTEGDW
jgi:hypothetical protein